jgi:subfamily B ATP-binding cassette protein MsbA
MKKSLASLLPYLRMCPRLAAATAIFGMLSSLAEGVGLSLFIPLLRGLDQTPNAAPMAGERFVQITNGAFVGMPAEQRVPVIALCILVAVFLRSALSYAAQLLYAALDDRVGRGLRSAAYQQLLDVEFGYWEQRASDKLFATLAEDTWRTTNAVRTLVFLVVVCGTLATYLSVLLLIDWKMTLLVSLALLVFHGLTRLLTRRAVAYGRVFTRANSTLTKRMIETFQGMKLIRGFGRERYERERFDRASSKVGQALFRSARMQAVNGPLLELLAAGTVVALLVTASGRSQDLAALLVFLLILYRLQAPVRDFANAVVGLNTLHASVEQVNALLRRDDKPYTLSGAVPFHGFSSGISFERVSFSYPGVSEAALLDVSVFLPHHQTTALVGPSGAGKSTFVKLLQRLYDPDAGVIRFDAHALPTLELEGLRKRVAVVSQDVYLFDTTVRNNIGYGRPDASLEEIKDAARKADAHGFISALPAGYQTRVGERGAALSGGQAQRIALARAIVAQPELLILDEATNALDTISENVVRDALNAMQGKCTIIIVAHRFSTIERAENIIVIEHGRILEQGSFGNLLRKRGLFARLHELQRGEVLAQRSAR